MKYYIKIRKTERFAILAIFLFYLSTAVFAQTTTVNTETRWHNDKVSIAYMNKQISDAAEKYKEYAPVPRAAFYDIGYPQNKAEFEELDGYCVLLLSTVSQNETELPLKRVYVLIDGKEIELTLFKEVFSKNSDANSQVYKTFGAFKVDSLYLIPVYLTKTSSDLLVDFAENRNGMKVVGFSGEVSVQVKNLPDTKPSGKASLTDAMKKFIKREYPGFFDN